MKVPVTWLREYCAPDMDVQGIEERLTMTGTKVEAIHHHGVGAVERFVVGRVLEVAPHPHADKLNVCKVDLGNGPATIVCGAANVADRRRQNDQVVGQLLCRIAVKHAGIEPLGGAALVARKGDVARATRQEDVAEKNRRAALVDVDVGKVPATENRLQEFAHSGEKPAIPAER